MDTGEQEQEQEGGRHLQRLKSGRLMMMIAVVAVCSEWQPGPWSSRVDEGGQVVLQDHHLGRAGSSGRYFSDDIRKG